MVITNARQLEAPDEYQVGDLVYDVISGWSGPVVSFDEDWVIFTCREKGRVKQHRDLIKTASSYLPSNHKTRYGDRYKSHPSQIQKANDFYLGQTVWTRITGELELAAIVNIYQGQVTVLIRDLTYNIDRFDPYTISSAE